MTSMYTLTFSMRRDTFPEEEAKADEGAGHPTTGETGMVDKVTDQQEWQEDTDT